MKMEGKIETKIEVELDDDDFLSQVAEAEATFLSDSNFNKRRRIAADAKVVNTEDKEKNIFEGAYVAALRGSKSIIWQQQNPLLNAVNSTLSRPNPFLPPAHDLSGSEPSIPEKNCPCGLPCVVFTANTERNQGRKFYKCPVRQENGGCGFFEWCDSASGTGTRNYASNSMFPDIPCPCGAGSGLILTAKTGKNIGQQFYKCPSIQDCLQQSMEKNDLIENKKKGCLKGVVSNFSNCETCDLSSKERSCGYFKWCDDNVVATNVSKDFNSTVDFSNKCYSVKTGSSFNSTVDFSNKSYSVKTGSSFNRTVDFSNNSYSVKTGSSCFKCGNEGHWAKDCPESSLSKSTSRGDFETRTTSSGSCYKCNKPGHWARNCTSTQYMNPS